MLTYDPNSTVKVSCRLDVAGIVGAPNDVDVLESEVGAVGVSAKNVVIFGIALGSAGDVLHQYVCDDDSI